jgi:predicted nucleotidyltransferase component of viral defense system
MFKDLDTMDLFGSVEHADDNSDLELPNIVQGATNTEILNYLALVTARNLEIKKAFKGGYMLNQLLGADSRMTHDIDFSIMNDEYYSKVKAILEAIAEKFMSANIIASYKIKDSISPTSSGGIDMYDATGKKIFGVDVGLHNLLYGTTNYKIDIGEVEAFSIERMLSDKLLAILSRKRFRRTKDLYDFYVITNHFDFDYEKLLYCINNRDNYDPSVWNNIPFSDTVLVEYEKAWDKLNLMNGINGAGILKPPFSNCVARVTLIALAIKNGEKHGYWSHTDYGWCSYEW